MEENDLKELSKLTKELTEAFINLNNFWSDKECGSILNEKYPFTKCFKELSYDVTKWNYEVQSVIAKEQEQYDLKCTLKKLAMTNLTPRELQNILFADFYDVLCKLDREKLGIDTIVKIIEANGMTKSQYEDIDYLVEKIDNYLE